MTIRRIVLAALLALSLIAIAMPATAGHVQVTKGHFDTLPGGTELGYRITGAAMMVRLPDDGGQTNVLVRVSGLDPNTTYPTHVHNQPCSFAPPGGGHYQNLVGGPVDAVNEIWPVIHTNSAGNGIGVAGHAAWARPEAQSIVIHYPPDTSIRLACVDLT